MLYVFKNDCNFLWTSVFFYNVFLEETRSSGGKTCRSINGPGHCVSLKICDPLMRLLEENPNAGHRAILESLCSPSELVVCCPQRQTSNDNNKDKGKTEKAQTATGSSHYKPLNPPQCGFSDVPHDRVVGGNPSEIGKYCMLYKLYLHMYIYLQMLSSCIHRLYKKRTIRLENFDKKCK